MMKSFKHSIFGDISENNAKPILGSLLLNGCINQTTYTPEIIEQFVSECLLNGAVTIDWIERKRTLATGTPLEKIQLVVKNANVLNDVELTTRYAKKAKNTAERGIEWNLTFTQYKKLIKAKRCYYTGVEFEETGDNSKTIDRIDSNIGYTVENSVMCTNRVNQLKCALFESPSSSFKTTPNELMKIVSKLIAV